MSKSMLLENYARKITDIASENLGEEIVLFDTGEISLFSEFSILITGQTDRHLESLSQKIMREMNFEYARDADLRFHLNQMNDRTNEEYDRRLKELH